MKQIFLSAIIVGFAAAFFSCAHTGPRFRAPASATQEAHILYDGFWAAPGSPARKLAAEELQRWLDDTVKATADGATDQFTKQAHEQSRGIYQTTIDYMKADRTCSAREKVRLFRGVSEKQIVRRGNQILIPWSMWTYRAVMNREKIPADRQTDHKEDPFADLSYKTVELNDRNFDWDHISSEHSDTDSGVSSLISASLERGVSKDFANPYLLVMDVCLERSLALVTDGNGAQSWPEAEVYLPLAVFPEEITAVLEWPKDDPFYKISDAELPPLTPVGKALRRVFFGKDLPFDVQYVTDISIRIPSNDAGHPSVNDYFGYYSSGEYYDMLVARVTNGQSLDDWRGPTLKKLLAFQPSATTCDYSYGHFMKSKVYKTGSHPKRSFRFPDSHAVSAAKFDLQEYRAVKQWQSAWAAKFDTNNMDQASATAFDKNNGLFGDYFENFSSYQIVQQKLYVGYPEACRKAP